MIRLSVPSPIKNSSILLSGSKSISNRLLILGKVLDLDLKIQNLSVSEDTQLLTKALSRIRGHSRGLIDIHHAGTDMRFLTALLSVSPGDWTLTGSERMKQRPVGALTTALRSLGAEIHYLEAEHYPPLRIQGRPLKGGSIRIDSSVSSQFISALLLVAPALEEGLQLQLDGDTVSRPYIDMTLDLLKAFGMNVQASDRQLGVKRPLVFNPPLTFQVESDWSSASYWYSLCALSGSGEFRLRHLSPQSSQADAVLPLIYRQLGVSTHFSGERVTLSPGETSTSHFRYDFTTCPDIAQTVAVTCFGLGISCELTGLSTLKIKETDRILALQSELGKLGAEIAVTTDSITIAASSPVRKKDASGIVIRTWHDHRMAMAFAPLALIHDQLGIDDPGVVNKSYPGFWQDLKSVGFHLHLSS
jgi:3-phosphoshikimate 1-carboxyvinyltransferase